MSLSLKARLSVSIVVLVGVIVTALSALYLGSLVENSFGVAETVARINLEQIEAYIRDRASAEMARREPVPTTADEVVEAYVEIVGSDPVLAPLLQRLTGYSPVIVEGRVTGPGDRILAASLGGQGQKHAPMPALDEFMEQSLWAKLAQTLSMNQEYEVATELGFELDGEPRRVLAIRMIFSTVLMREQVVLPRVRELAFVSLIALIGSLVAALIVSQLAVRPFAHIGDLIDRITSGDEQAERRVHSAEGAKEIAAVESKLSLLGDRYRGARQDAEDLRGNIDQLLARLEEAVLLFGRDDRLVMAGGSAERLLGAGRWDLLGRSMDEIFDETTELGALVQSLVSLRRAVRDRPATLRTPDGRELKLLVSVEILEEFPSRDRVGALVTLREAEPRRQLESRLDVSTRLAAISRLTSGAAHEIKNPLNSIALHLEVLRAKAEEADVGAEEIEVITREIRRLDRVVKSFLDFTRPVELQVEKLDLVRFVDELAKLTRPDAERSGVRIATDFRVEEAPVRADRDLLEQALLNVIVNGLQAMPDGGELRLGVEAVEEGEGGGWVVTVQDEGVGIPPEAAAKIYDLYFTTKKEKGSGIGLAMTFRVVQLHGGTIDFASEVGRGTQFRIGLPAASEPEGEGVPAAAQPAEDREIG